MDDIVSVTPRQIAQKIQDGLAHFDEGRFEQALAVFDDALTRFGPDLDLLRWKGISLRRLGRLREATDALEESADDVASRYELAVLLLEEDVDSARGQSLLEVLSEAGDLPSREYLAHRAYEAGQFADVVDLSRRERADGAADKWPESVECLETLEGIALTELGRLDEARFHLKRASRRDPGCASHLTNLGRIYQLEKRYPRALGCYLRAVELDPDDPVPQINLAHLYEEMGRGDAARAVFNGLYQTFDMDPSVLEDYARFLARNGNVDGAVKLVERALQQAPEGPAGDDMAAFLGWLVMDAGDQARARAIWEDQVIHRKDAFAARHYLAGMLAQSGDRERALTLLEEAALIDSEGAMAWCRPPHEDVEDYFQSLRTHPRFIAVAGAPEPTNDPALSGPH